MPRALRAVTEDDTPKPQMNVSQAVAANNTRAQLVAMRVRIAKAIDSLDTSPRDLAALTRRLQDITKEIESLGDDDSEGTVSEGKPSGDEAFDATAV